MGKLYSSRLYPLEGNRKPLLSTLGRVTTSQNELDGQSFIERRNSVTNELHSTMTADEPRERATVKKTRFLHDTIFVGIN